MEGIKGDLGTMLGLTSLVKPYKLCVVVCGSVVAVACTSWLYN